jgi:hypothetical protein
VRLAWTPAGATTPTLLNPPSYWVQDGSLEGFDMSTTSLATVRGPHQRGATAVETVWDERTIGFDMELVAESAAAMATLMRATSRLFSPGAGMGQLRWTRDDGQVLAVRAQCSGGPVYPAGNRNAGHTRQLCQITLQCPDPFWVDPVEKTAALGQQTGGFELPLVLPFSLGTDAGGPVAQNNGDVDVPVSIVVTGPCAAPEVRNDTTGETFRATCTLLAGESLVVLTEYGRRSATRISVGGGTSDALGEIDLLSDWVRLVPGDNALVFPNGASSPGAACTVSWYDRYIGG